MRLCITAIIDPFIDSKMILVDIVGSNLLGMRKNYTNLTLAKFSQLCSPDKKRVFAVRRR
jgi:hypothetical protein